MNKSELIKQIADRAGLSQQNPQRRSGKSAPFKTLPTGVTP